MRSGAEWRTPTTIIAEYLKEFETGLGWDWSARELIHKLEREHWVIVPDIGPR